MDEVKRYKAQIHRQSHLPHLRVAVLEEDSEGRVVLHTDYAKLEAERDEAKRILLGMYTDNADYCIKNHMKAALNNHYMVQAREFLGESAKQALRDLGVME